MSQTIYNYNLSSKKYDIGVLEANIKKLSLVTLLITQQLTSGFCAKYILHPETYATKRDDYYITYEYILKFQKHITLQQLIYSINEKNDDIEEVLSQQLMDIPIIQNNDLQNNLYSIETLEANINKLSLKGLLRTQYLTADFCAKYILNPEEYAIYDDDYYFKDTDILKEQQHITEQQLIDAKNIL